MDQIIGFKELRENAESYIKAVQKGKSFIVARKSRPLFKISPVHDDAEWETVIDFTKIKRGGVRAEDILARL